MKKALFYTILFSCAFAVADEANLIENGDFENGLTAWRVSGNKSNPSSAKIDENVVFIEGSKSLKLDVKNNPPEIRYNKKRSPVQLISRKEYLCKPGQKFLLSGWVKGTTGIKIMIVADGGIYNKKHWFKTVNIIAKPEWTQFKKEFSMPDVNSKKYSPERKGFKLRLAVQENNTVDGNVWIDNLKLIEVD